ncbi:hypothetical protein EVAR_5232_1 [Eumeta japonica]|uniref:Helitron helicase-like domain-containing protein n=1 Tax=Eumeta variegata TaxID=151549 RepID=A0A4C1XMD5_EUMVA|nr:hypothetical protein EVAR_5232_1 [Eumeta japonica]
MPRTTNRFNDNHVSQSIDEEQMTNNDNSGNWCYGQGMSALSCSEIQNEPAGMCCASGKVQLPEIETPPEPLNGLLIGTDPDSNVFLKRIVSELDALLNEHNELLKIFKSHMHQLQSDNHAIVINPDKTPAGEHIRRFNAPVVDDVAGIMVGDCTAAREIVIRRRNNNLQFIADTHRSYDALQYPLIFWKGQDGYCINIKQRDTVSGAETNKNVSSKDYYAYRLMIRRGLDNVILRCRALSTTWSTCTRRLRANDYALRYNQTKLRAEEYIHLRDATTPTSPKLVTMSFYHHRT